MRHGDRNINEVVRVFDALTGFGVDTPFQPVKYGDDTLGQHEAARNILGDDNWRALISGQVSAERVGDVLQLKDKPKPSELLFDKNGFPIKPTVLKARTTKPNTGYYFNTPSINVDERLGRIVQYLGIEPFITAREFADRFAAIIKRIETDETTAKLLKSPWLPFALPQMNVNWTFAGKPVVQTAEDNGKDYGQVLDEKFLPAVEKSYRQQFPERPFTNYRKGELAGQTTIIEGSRHERLVEAMRQGVVVGVYFPSVLQGFSVDADRELMSSLPEQFLLAGALEAAACYIAYPDMLARDGKTPLLDLAAMQWQSSEYSLCFYSRGGRADFGLRSSLSVAGGYCAGGLVVLG